MTFDQPLYWKALTIMENESPESAIKSVVLRLGGFHNEMSFLGAIRNIMSGSGLAEVLETVYATNTVSHMLNRKAISRAIRGHFLVSNTLCILMVSEALPNSIYHAYKDGHLGTNTEDEQKITDVDSHHTEGEQQLTDIEEMSEF